MKSLWLALALTLISLPAAVIAQHEHAPAPSSPDSTAAQKTFEKLKALTGSWEGTVTPIPPVKEFAGARVKVMIRETSRGNALLHEMTIAGIPDDPITLFYLDGDRLMMTHYCDMGNRPRMVGKIAPDGNTVAFQMVDVSGSTQRGHMSDAVFTIVDANHHLEEWTSNAPGGQRMMGRLDLQRTKEASGPFGQ